MLIDGIPIRNVRFGLYRMVMAGLIIILAGLNSTLPSQADIIRVPADWPTIQAGIDVAVDGDTVLVSPGTYLENLNFMGKKITVRSSDGPDVTVIDGSQAKDPQFGSTVTFNHQEDRLSVIAGFSITGGTGMFYVSGPPYFQEYFVGGGIVCNRSSPTILDNSIHDNNPTEAADGSLGGGIFCHVDSSPHIAGNRIISNTAFYGAGIMSMETAEPMISENQITGNQAFWGGGIYVFGWSRPAILDNTIANNTASNGAGILARGVSHARLRGNQILGNSAEKGGGIYSENSYLRIINCLIAGNDAQVGGGINCYAISEPRIINCTFVGNTATVRGGGMEIAYLSRPKVANSIWWENDSPLGREINFSTHTFGPPELHISYSNLQGGPQGLGKCEDCIIHWGPGMMDADPIFVTGPHGDFYLSQAAGGQPAESPSVEAGDPLGISLWATTGTGGLVDRDVTDQGFHYPLLAGVAAGAGPAASNPPLIRLFQARPDNSAVHQFMAYGDSTHGVSLCCGDVDGDLMDELVSGPGRGSGIKAHVRGFLLDGTQIPGLSFLAYETMGNGVNLAIGDLDGNGREEIITAPGQGFGTRIRAFSYDRYVLPPVNPVAGVDFQAYSAISGGVNIAAGDIDGDGMDEIITGAGPQSWFGPHVRGWDVDGYTATAIPAVDFMAYFWRTHGVVVAAGDIDGDGIDELITAPGPDSRYGAMIVGWNYDGSAISRLPGCTCLAWPQDYARFGAHLSSGRDLKGDGRDEIVVGGGPDPEIGSPVIILRYNGSALIPGLSLETMPPEYSSGAIVAVGRFGGYLPFNI